MIALDVADAVKMQVVAVIDLADDTSIAVGFVCDDGHRAMQPHTFDRFVQKSLCCFCILPGSQAKSIIWPFASIARHK